MKIIKFTNVITIVILLYIISGCNQDKKQINEAQKPNKENFIKANKSLVQEELEMINNYINRRKYTNVINKNGVYIIKLKDGSNDTIKEKDQIEITYTIKLINGKTIESQRKPINIIVGKSGNLPMGVHYGLKNLYYGDQAIIIVPSHMAYGLAGNEIIPPKSTLIYELNISKR